MPKNDEMPGQERTPGQTTAPGHTTAPGQERTPGQTTAPGRPADTTPGDLSLEVRVASATEVPLLVEFQLRMAWETEELQLDPDRVAAGVSAVFEVPRKGTYWVAETGGEVIACLLTWPEWSDWRNVDVWWIASLYVVPAFRGLGVFRHLYEHLREQVRRSSTVGGLRLYVDKRNVAAQEVYQAIGMSREHYDLFEWLE